MPDARKIRIASRGVAGALLLLTAAGTAAAQDNASPGGPSDGPAEPPPAAEELAKKLSNPIASLISVPFQQNVDFGAGPDGHGIKTTLNIQPVVPIGITPKW